MDFLTAQLFVYKIEENGAVILRCFSRDGHIRIPGRIAGVPVVGLAPYAFSAHMDENALYDALREGKAWAAEPDTGATIQNNTYTSAGQELSHLSAVCAEKSVHGVQDTSHPSEACSGKTVSGGQDTPHMPAAYAEKISVACSAMCGEALEEIILPLSLRHVGRYCFYNCSNLRRLKFSGGLIDWGSGCFTGCHQVKELCVCADPDGETGLKQVLDELPESLKVEFCAPLREQARADSIAMDYEKPVNDSTVSTGKCESPAEAEPASEDEAEVERRICARLVFPEFYEEGVENTPARILETHVHGTGIRYRNCFPKNRLDFSQYDALFPYARAQENEELLLELILGRLRWPYRLKSEAQNAYEEYVRENLLRFGKYFLDAKDPEGLRWFLERFAGTQETCLRELSEYANRKGDTGAVSILMDFGNSHRSAAPRRRRLEL
ncbi:MAG: leucine-rich repeat domain-containing protein [Clostridiales bacterium]|nr:leucine-rich repeat domain-containing protein [Clostridiales bacterium]